MDALLLHFNAFYLIIKNTHHLFQIYVELLPCECTECQTTAYMWVIKYFQEHERNFF